MISSWNATDVNKNGTITLAEFRAYGPLDASTTTGHCADPRLTRLLRDACGGEGGRTRQRSGHLLREPLLRGRERRADPRVGHDHQGPRQGRRGPQQRTPAVPAHPCPPAHRFLILTPMGGRTPSSTTVQHGQVQKVDGCRLLRPSAGRRKEEEGGEGRGGAQEARGQGPVRGVWMWATHGAWPRC